jgi:hypothetical protein
MSRASGATQQSHTIFGSGGSLAAIPMPKERGKTPESVVLSRNMGKQLR